MFALQKNSIGFQLIFNNPLQKNVPPLKHTTVKLNEYHAHNSNTTRQTKFKVAAKHCACMLNRNAHGWVPIRPLVPASGSPAKLSGWYGGVAWGELRRWRQRKERERENNNDGWNGGRVMLRTDEKTGEWGAKDATGANHWSINHRLLSSSASFPSAHDIFYNSYLFLEKRGELWSICLVLEV